MHPFELVFLHFGGNTQSCDCRVVGQFYFLTFLRNLYTVFLFVSQFVCLPTYVLPLSVLPFSSSFLPPNVKDQKT